jgi:hypothetical protein
MVDMSHINLTVARFGRNMKATGIRRGCQGWQFDTRKYDAYATCLHNLDRFDSIKHRLTRSQTTNTSRGELSWLLDCCKRYTSSEPILGYELKFLQFEKPTRSHHLSGQHICHGWNGSKTKISALAKDRSLDVHVGYIHMFNQIELNRWPWHSSCPPW